MCFIDKFWSIEDWLYLSNEMVINDFGYSLNRSTLSDFYKNILIKNFSVNEDYKEVNKEFIKKIIIYEKIDEIIPKNGGNNKKYYIISRECYKNLIMLIKTDKGKENRKYYMKIEDLSKKTDKIIYEIKTTILTKDFEEKIKIETEKNLKLSRFVDGYYKIQKMKLYIACIISI
jgi:phage anti-repressor protein